MSASNLDLALLELPEPECDEEGDVVEVNFSSILAV